MQGDKIAIADVVPHAGAMLFLDQLISQDEDSVVAEAGVDEEHLFATPEGVPGWVGIEFMAQAIAAWAGCRARARGEPVRIGFLLGTRRYECRLQHFAFGSRLRIEVRREIFGDNGLGMFACRLFHAGEEIACANLSVFEPRDAAAFLEGHSP
ncbi:hypothetical protein [Arenimonas sp.]|uniref:ApeP family dehydratase n=1 Tax=Arenimonas sp. TaxID=1872635 RepID=UPI0039E51D11